VLIPHKATNLACTLGTHLKLINHDVCELVVVILPDFVFAEQCDRIADDV